MKQRNGTVKPLLRSIKKDMAVLTKHWRGGEGGAIGEWLKDNYYLIFAGYSSFISALKGKRLPLEGDLPRAFRYAERYCELSDCRMERISFESYLSRIGAIADLQIDEVLLFPKMFTAALIKRMARCIGEEDGVGDFSRSVTSLRFLSDYDIDGIFSSVCRSESILLQCKSYELADRRTKDFYRHRLSIIAKRRGVSESEVAEEAVLRSKSATLPQEKDVGYYLLPKKKKRLYIPLTFILPAVLSFILSFLTEDLWVLFLSYIPLRELCKGLLWRIYSASVPHTPIPRIRITDSNCKKTAVCTVSLISSEKDALSLCSDIALYSQTNRLRALRFGILADLPESSNAENEADGRIVNALRGEIERLNREVGYERFFCAVRKRRKNPESGRFDGYERKRGAICDLMAYLSSGDDQAFLCLFGDILGSEYVVTLDSDTRPSAGSIASLVGIMEHPLSTPVLNEEKTAVVQGFGAAAPSIDVSLSGANKNLFCKLYAGPGGAAMYGDGGFDIYQDLYGEGIFCGKGILSVECFNNVIAGRFPENRILSHDILEGGFLNCATVNDVSFYDSVPQSLLSATEREHRWVRGDWQNLPYLFGRIPTAEGSMKNPFSSLMRYKLLDNILRSLLMPFALFSLIPLFFGEWVPFLVALSAIGSDFLFSLFKRLSFPCGEMLYFRSGIFRSLVRLFFLSVLNASTLLYQGASRLDAICKALWRLVRKRKLLEWKTADQTDKALKNTVGEYLLKMRAQWLCFLFVAKPILLPLSAVFIFGIFFSYVISKRGRSVFVSGEGTRRARVLGWCADMWHYYEDLLSAENNFLPPDNYQEAPLGAHADRTSPTNIGLCLLSVVAAHDLSFLSLAEMGTLLNRMLDTVIRLEKWNGQLYNWYEVSTLKPLLPRYVSTVDNGNFLASLVTLRNAIRGRRELSGVLLKVERLIKETDLSLLYNAERDLFHIGYEVEKNEFSNNFYDLFASECKLTSYVAIALGHVPVKHWKRLSRVLFRQRGYLCMKSWSGTAFEYFMPHIFMPVPCGSVFDEVLKTVFFEERKASSGLPFGVSESGYSDVDAMLQYQYKAFGLSSLGLKRGLEKDYVVSPYSSFLMLPHFPQASFSNLLRLEEEGFVGKYGFYEAVDYTRSRTGGGPVAVRSFMTHHLSMSLLSAVNYLKDGIFVKRFFDSVETASCSELLEEKLPMSVPPYREPRTDYDPVRVEHSFQRTATVDSPNPAAPSVFVLGDGKFCETVTDSGAGFISCDGKTVTRYRDSADEPKGVFLLLKSDDKVFSPTYAPLYDDGIEHRCEAGEGCVTFFAKSGGIECAETVVGAFGCSVRDVRIKNLTSKEREVEFLFYAEPTLIAHADEMNHPAFASLFCEYAVDKNSSVVVKRRSRGENAPFFGEIRCVFGGEVEIETDRSRVLDCGVGILSLSSAFQKPFGGASSVGDGCACMRGKITLSPRESRDIRLIISAGSDRDALSENVSSVSEKSVLDVRREGEKAFSRIANRIGVTQSERRLCDLFVSSVSFSSSRRFGRPEYRNDKGIDGLWKHGISGDLPIILIKVSADSFVGVESFIKAFLLMRELGASADMVFVYSEGGRYDRPLFVRLRSAVERLGGGRIIGKRGGIFLLDASLEDFILLSSVCRFYADTGSDSAFSGDKVGRFSLNRAVRPRGIPAKYTFKCGVGGFTENGFAVDDKKNVPSRAIWSHVLANPFFGTVVSDSSLGFTYALNSQGNRLTQWNNDSLLGCRGERLYMTDGGAAPIDVIGGGTAFFEKDIAEYVSVHRGVTVRVRVFVPRMLKVKVIRVIVEGEIDAPIFFRFSVTPVLGSGSGASVVRRCAERAVFFTDPLNRERPSACAFISSPTGRVSGGDIVCRVDPEGGRDAFFFLGYGGSEKRAEMLLSLLDEKRALMEEERLRDADPLVPQVKIETPDKALDSLVNSFLPYYAVKSRMLARGAFYQCGGAYGFRDQLQDAICLASFSPILLKHQILRSAARQFVEGDVFHWWHECDDGSPKGVRTKCSDDLLWLPAAVCRYCKETGDFSILDRRVSYIVGEKLFGEESKYFKAERSDVKESVYLHCVRAIKRGLTKGEHGLMLFLCGDWNDGMNRVGAEGRGESVWLTQFSVLVLESFAEISAKMNDTETRDLCLGAASDYRRALDSCAWDGDRWLRGFYDDGSVLGGKACEECAIDILPQAFGTFLAPRTDRSVASLRSVDKYLVDRKNGIVKLFAPPFDDGHSDPGYIKGYIPGIRENGGQYTHAALWYVAALYMNWQVDGAYKILSLLNPVNHSLTEGDVEKYRLEPYAVAGDVYSCKGGEGRGGWSIYTGSAGWYFKVVTELLLGIKRNAETLDIMPLLPSSWNGFRAEITVEKTRLDITVKRGRNKGVSVDGKSCKAVLLDSKKHVVEVVV